MRAALCGFFLIQGLLFSGLPPISAQTILVQVTQAETGHPIPGAFLSLFHKDGTLIRQALTNSEGRFQFRPGGAGSFMIRAEMIGRETQEESGVLVWLSETRNLVFPLPVLPIPLQGISVEAEERCRLLPEEASAISVVWEEARKALTVQEWTEQEQLFRFQVVNYERDMDAEARRFERETRQVSTGVSNNPIRSLPPEELMAKGFIHRSENGGWDYWGPDATVLLSDEFLDTHCFHLRSDEDNPGALGLAFQPFRATERPDIEGTLWLDRETASLQFLEFSYTWAEFPEARGMARGRVEFDGLPNGAWIVRNWWIRMPHLSQDRSRARAGRSGVFVSGVRESGARVAQISTLDRQRVDQVRFGSVEGVIGDSTTRGPLEGAEVYLSGTSHSTYSDAEGRFLLGEVPQGSFLAAFTHPRLEALGVFGLGVEVQVNPDSVSNAILGVPSLETLVLESCSREDREKGPAFLRGVVWDPSNGERIVDATVEARWLEVVDVRTLIEMKYETRTDQDGRYVACTLPDGVITVVQASYMDRQSDPVEVRVQEYPYPVVSLEIELIPGSVQAESRAGDPPPAVRVQEDVGRRGAEPEEPEATLLGLIRGRALDWEGSTPLPSVEVVLTRVPSPTEELAPTATTLLSDEAGGFSFSDLQPGTYTLRASFLGRGTVEDSLVVEPSSRLNLELRMPADPIPMEEILVEVESGELGLELAGFYDRAKRGHGIFMTREQIEDRAPITTVDLFEGHPSVRVVRGGIQRAVMLTGSRIVNFDPDVDPNRGSKPCYPAVWLDGMPVHAGATDTPAYIDNLVDPYQIAGVEVYTSAARIPVQFNIAAACGVIVIWTR